MKLTHQSRLPLPIEDYSFALRKAVKWLGERYVLAAPVRARTADATDHSFFSERRPWNRQVRRRSS
jgi:hypothetical protein